MALFALRKCWTSPVGRGVLRHCGAASRIGTRVLEDAAFPRGSAIWNGKARASSTTPTTSDTSASSSETQEAPPGQKMPTLEEARMMPSSMSELSNVPLIILAEQGSHEACKERLIRDIMRVDNIEWVDARVKMREIQKKNGEMLWLATLPHQIGITTALVTGFGCIPLVFHFKSVKWFNEKFVTAELPPTEDLTTFYEVGSWSWGWMEPVLGTASFTLLALQFMRAQMDQLDIAPYTQTMREKRADRLVNLYPMYSEDIIRDFARTASMSPFVRRGSSDFFRDHDAPKKD